MKFKNNLFVHYDDLKQCNKIGLQVPFRKFVEFV